MKTIVITTENFFENEAEAINDLFKAGLYRLHIRKPNSSESACEKLISGINRKWYSQISLHDHFQLAKKYGLGGLHLNKRNPVPPTGFAGMLSCSCHSLDEIKSEKYKFDYLFLSPIFDSISKEGYGSRFSGGELQAAAANKIIDAKIFALGGITPTNISSVAACNFGGAAVLGFIWQNGATQAVERFNEIMAAARRQAWATKLAPPVVLTIAGSDCSGGAGIQADIKVIEKHACYASAVITAVTVQNTTGVKASHPLDASLVKDQITAVLDDLAPAAIKIGMVCNKQIAKAIADCLATYRCRNVVFDPVMASTNGHTLMDNESIATVVNTLMPLCSLITPNLPEAAIISGRGAVDSDNTQETCLEIAAKTSTACLLKGGHANNSKATDVLYYGGKFYKFSSQMVASENLHGTGCVLSSAIAASLAHGLPLPKAVKAAKNFVSRSIKNAAGRSIGHGNGPIV